MDYREHQFANENVEMEGHTYTNCTFRGCVLVFNGSEGECTINASRFINCHVGLAGAAFQTLCVLHDLYHNGFIDDIKELLDIISRPGEELPHAIVVK